MSFNGGVQYLLEHLRGALGRPQISDMTDHLNRYFKATKRKKMESMNEYVTRKTEAYARARQAYTRVAEQYDRQTWRNWSWRSNHDSWQSWTESARGEEDEEYHSGVDENPEGAEQDPWAQFDHHATSRGTRSVTEDEH